MRIVNKITLFIFLIPIKFYQYFISPILPCSCRYVPTCSEYACEALKINGIFYGSIMIIKRILKCNPLGGSGFHPVIKLSSKKE